MFLHKLFLIIPLLLLVHGKALFPLICGASLRGPSFAFLDVFFYGNLLVSPVLFYYEYRFALFVEFSVTTLVC